MELSLRACRLTCGRCGTPYEEGLLTGGYGRLVVRDTAGRHPAVADLMADPLVDLLAEAATARSALFGRVSGPPDLPAAFVALCDPSPDGLPRDLGAQPGCPVCGGAPVHVERLEGLVEVDLPVLTHEALDALEPAERRARVEAELGRSSRRREG